MFCFVFQMGSPAVWMMAMMCLRMSMARRGDTEESIVFGCSGDRAPLVSTGQGNLVADSQAGYSHEGR